MGQDFYSYFDAKDAATKKLNASYEFLSTGVILGSLGGSKCYTSYDCGSGWGCVNNQCVYLSQPNSDSLCGTGPSGSGGCGGGSGCGTSTPGTSCLAADCCGNRCCRYSQGGGGFVNVSCFCGECPEEEKECSGFCDNYYKNGGTLGEGCPSSLVCSECSYCSSSGRCVISNTGPCWCLADIGYCNLCTESGAIVSNTACWPCRDYTKCGKPTGEYFCAQGGVSGFDTINGRVIDAPCDEEEELDCSGVCQTLSIEVAATGSMAYSYPNCCPTCNCTTQGFIQTSGSNTTTYLIEQCDKANLPEECSKTDCRCHSDCPSCYKCDNGTCVVDPGCPGAT